MFDIEGIIINKQYISNISNITHVDLKQDFIFIPTNYINDNITLSDNFDVNSKFLIIDFKNFLQFVYKEIKSGVSFEYEETKNTNCEDVLSKLDIYLKLMGYVKENKNISIIKELGIFKIRNEFIKLKLNLEKIKNTE